MSAMLATVGASVGLVLGALVTRREVERRVASRSVGIPVELPTMQKVLDVGDGVWRGPAPSGAGYTELAAAGCTQVVDLRAEADLGHVTSRAAATGMKLVVLATNNTRAPSKQHLDQFVAALASASGTTYVHCEAGEGRTGAIIGAYQVRQGCDPQRAMADALAIGSLTFSQLSYIAMAARAPLVTKLIDLGLDRPTEAGFDLLRQCRN